MTRDLTPLFHPRSVAVIGASDRPESLAGAVFRNLDTGGFSGRLLPVHPRLTVLGEHPVYPDLAALPETPDLAVFGVQASAVETGIETLLERGTRAFLVLSAGFGETSGESARPEASLAAACRKAGAVLLGPNCMGFHRVGTGDRIDASFSRVRPQPGAAILLSQSGSIAEWLMLRLEERDLGLSLAVSLGNQADLGLVECLEAGLREAPPGAPILLYLETLEGVESLRRVLAEHALSRTFILHGGRSASGQRAVAGHTGALATEPNLVRARCRELGMTWIDSLTEAVDVLEIAAREPRPRGRRVAVVTNAGGPAVLATDALHEAGLPPPPPAPDLQTTLAGILPPGSTLDNPVDLLAPARPEDYTAALTALEASGAYDGILVLFMHPIITDARAIAGAILAHASASSGFTVVGWLGGPELTRPAATLRAGGVPVIEEPTRAGRALARWLEPGRRPSPSPPPSPRSWDPETTSWSETAWGDPRTLERFLAGDAIRIPEHRRVADRAAAGVAGREIGTPLVLKLESGSHPHKARAGRLRRAETGDELTAALDALAAAAATGPGRWLIQSRVPAGPEFFAGYLRHPRLGSFLSLGPGGSAVETTPPEWIGLPAGESEVAGLADRWAGSPALASALGKLLLRLAALEHEPTVAMAEVNPAIWDGDRETLWVVDARWQPRTG